MSLPSKKWIVGLDLRPRSQGAINFASHLVRAAKTTAREQLVGIHVLEEDHLRAALRYHHLDELVKAAQEATEHVLEHAKGDDCFEEIRIVQGGRAEKSLAAARVYHNAHGLIVGRYAQRDSRSLLRLGRVARRLLRSLTSPVVVVPPDWTTGPDSDGPVIAGIDLGDESRAAVQFAADMAGRLGKELVLAHVVPLPDDYGSHYLPAQSLDRLRTEHRDEGLRALESFAQENGVTGARREVLQGNVVEELREFGRESKASMIVTGSRRLSSMERILLSSVGSELAAAAACAVAVVPPSEVDDTPDTRPIS